MSIVEFFLSGANLPFVFAIGVAVTFVVLQWSGVLGLLGGGDAEADGDGDGDAEIDGEADVDGDAHGDADVDGEADADADDADGEDADDAPVAPKLPLSVRGPIAAVAFGIVGLGVNAVLYGEGTSVPWLSLLWTVPGSTLGAVMAARAVARALGPLLDETASAAPDRKSLVGRIGTVISRRVSADFGEVRIPDASGHRLRVVVKLAEGSEAPGEGDEVVVVDVDAAGIPRVAPLALHAAIRAAVARPHAFDVEVTAGAGRALAATGG